MCRALLVLAALALEGCVLTQRNYIRNDTDSALVVSVQQERKDLGWPRKEDKAVPLPSRSICRIRHDIFYETFLYIENVAAGRSTNIRTMEGDYVYAVSDAGGKQVVSISEADSKTEHLFGEEWADQCVTIESK